MLKKFTLSMALIAFAVGGVSSAPQVSNEEKVDEIGSQMICTCGCNQILGACNMIACSNSVPMRAELAGLVDEGLDEESILARFVEKYGLTVLAAPPTTGAFNISAWLMPFVVLIGGLFFVAYYVRRFRDRFQRPAVAAGVDDRSFQERLEEELSGYTPED